MTPAPDNVRSLDDLRAFVHQTLCEKENLLPDQFRLAELPLRQQGNRCGIQFTVQGPRSVRLGAIWAADRNQVYFYDARGERYLKLNLPHRPVQECEAA